MATSKSGANKRRGARRATARAPWSERDFQAWFKEHPHLQTGTPPGERVLVLRVEREFESVVDIVALDSQGRLVIIEVKNERTTRAAVGQALEYLSTYEDVTLEELAFEFDYADSGRLARMFREEFPASEPLTRIAEERRVFLAAPDFNPHSDVCAVFLSQVITQPTVRFALLQLTQVQADPIEFKVKEWMPRKLVPAQRLHDFVLSVGETLYYRLDESSPPVFWRLGKRKLDGTLKLLDSKEPRDLVVIKTHRRIQLEGEAVPFDVDVSKCGSAWTRDGRTARLLGAIGQASARRFVLVGIKENRIKKYALLPEPNFRRWKAMLEDTLPSWRELAIQAAKAGREPPSGKGAGRPDYDEEAFRVAVKQDLKEVADYGTDHTYTVRDRVWQSLYGDLPVPEELQDVTGAIVDEEWDWWFEEGPIE